MDVCGAGLPNPKNEPLMRILFYMGHPAHFHLFRNTILQLKSKGHRVIITSKKKDVLEDLLHEAGLEHHNLLAEGRADNKFSIAWGMIKRDFRLFKLVQKLRPQLLVGTSVENSHIGRLLGIPVINVNEDDAHAVPHYARLSYPGATVVLSPVSCNNGKWEIKSIKYPGYHELAYLHPKVFIPDSGIVAKYLNPHEPYFLLRFAKLTAHHDSGVRGLSAELAQKIIGLLEPHGRVLISSERRLDGQFDRFRLNVHPLDMHHVMSFARIYIGDSQTMAAEAGVLGVPFIRYNDFVGRLGYLAELENDFNLGFGILPDKPKQLLESLGNLLAMNDMAHVFKQRRDYMLTQKIELSGFLCWFIENFPNSVNVVKSRNEKFWEQFK